MRPELPSRCVVVALVAGCLAGHSAPPASAQMPPPEGMAVGLVHVDLMDLHVARLPAGGTVIREQLPAADIADRYAQASASGASWNRWSLYWDMVEQPDGRLDWSAADAILARDAGAGLASLLILQGTPPSRAGAASAGLCRAAEAAPASPRPGSPSTASRLSRSLGRADRPCRVEASPPRDLEAATFLDAAGRGTEDAARAQRVNPGNPWAVFVAAAVDRYRPGGVLASGQAWPAGRGVRAWEVGNEPNLAHFWSGTADQFARYQEVAWRVIHWRDPQATVLHGGIADDAGAADWYRGFLAAVSRRLAAAGLSPVSNLPFDAAAWHWYVYPSLLQTGPDRARQLLIQAGLPERPIWVTELGVPIWNEHPGPCWDPISPWRATATEQAAYLWQAFAESLASRVAAVFFFQLYDDCGNGPTSYDAFGLLRNHASNQCWTPPEGRACWPRDPALDGRPRPGFHALAAWSRELAGASLLWRPPREDNFTQRILFFRPPDSRVTVLWNLLRSEQTLAFFATGPAGTLWRLGPNGLVQSTALGPVGGRYSIALAGATNRNNPGNQAAVMAGPPQILVERDTAAPFRSLVDALPERSPRSFELKVRAADGGTGVGSFELLGASGDCSAPVGWRILTSGPWTADPLAGDVAWRVEGLPGQRLCFAARAADRAGNWTAAPSAPQAVTMIEDGLPSATAGASASTTPSAWPPTPPPSATATAEARATATPGPGPTVTETAVSTPTVTAEPLATATRPSAMGPALYLPWLRAGTPADGAAAGTETRRPDR